MEEVFRIPVVNLSHVTEYVKKLNRRAAKLGSPPVELTISAEFEVKGARIREDGISIPQRFNAVNVLVLGSPPKLNGWALIASVELLDDLNIVRAVPGESVPVHYRETDGRCEHCGTLRRRKDVFVLRHDDGTLRQVGRQCIADFLGHVSASEIAARATYLAAFREMLTDCEHFGGSGPLAYEITEYLAASACAIRNWGWVSRAKANVDIGGVTATCDSAFNVLGPTPFAKMNDTDWELAGKAVDWVLTVPADTPNDYLANCLAVARHGLVTFRSAGIAASIVSAYQREVSRAVEEGLRAQRGAKSAYVGEVGKRAVFAVTIVKVIPIESVYGATNLHIMEDEEGNQLKWFTSAQSLDLGAKLRLKGTVKAHEVYKGTKATALSRCTVVS